MATLKFKAGSQPHTIYKILSQGGSLTHEEAIPHKIGRLAQRISDMKKKFEDAGVESPIMVLNVVSGGGVKIARYFFKNHGSPLESNPNAKKY